MRVLQVLNKRNHWGGEDNSIDDTVRIFSERGIETELWTRDVSEVGNSFLRKFGVLFEGVYSVKSARILRRILREYRPDIVEMHNIYPQLSPSVFKTCSQAGIPTIWHPHDQKFLCPTGMHLNKGKNCELCAGGHEYQCILQNCRGKISESVGYALWAWSARKMNMFGKFVTLFVVWAEYLKDRLIKAGYSADRIEVVPHPIPIHEESGISLSGTYVGYIGRISPEKGIRTLVEAAKGLGDIPIHIAGDTNGDTELVNNAPPSVKFVGWCDKEKKRDFFKNARIIVIPSIWFEVFPTVALEALSYGVPVIGASIGGIPEVVIDNKTGLLFETRNSEQLAEKIGYLWGRPDLCTELGKAGRNLMLEKYSEQSYFDALMQAFQKAIDLKKES